MEKTNREATVTRTDKGIRILVYNYSNDPTGHPIPPLKMTVPSGWQITYSIEAIYPSPQTVGEGIVSENNYFIYYVLVEKTGDTVYTENEILDWYLSMDIGSEPIMTTTPITTDVTTTETTVVTTQTTAISTTSAAETTPITTTVTTPDIKGDANGDGKFSASDAAFIAKELAQSSISGEKITAEDYPAMDFNQDGKVTAKDAADIARYLAEQSIT